MIWFFLTGWIAGVIGTVMFAKWWMRRHIKPVSLEEVVEIGKAKEKELMDKLKEEENHD